MNKELEELLAKYEKRMDKATKKFLIKALEDYPDNPNYDVDDEDDD